MSELLTFGRVRLVSSPSSNSAAASGQPKRLALLSYLVVATPRGLHRRDTLLARFWPELSDEEGRRALRQALHHLRRAVGENAVVTHGDEVGIAEGAIKCDAVEFDRLLETGRSAEAMALYEGDFFDGFHVSDVAPEFEEWVDRTRARLRTRAGEGARRAADDSEHTGQIGDAVRWARRSCELVPDDETGWRRLISLLDRAGDRAGALRTYDELSDRLGKEFGTRPAADTVRLAEEIRARPVEISRPVAVDRPMPLESSVGTAPASPIATPAATVLQWPRRSVFAAAAAVAALAVWAAVWQGGRAEEATLIRQGLIAPKDRVIVAQFANLARDSLLAAGVTEAFRTDLSQTPIVRVLSPRQIRSALARMQQSPDVALNDSLAREIAVREGVKAFVTGSIANLAGTYAITVQLVESQRGDVLTGFREVASDSNDVIGAVDRVSARLRARIGESMRDIRASPPLAEATTGSLEALRKYTEGQRLFRASDRTGAIKLLEEAVAIDTGFAFAYQTLGAAYDAIAEPGRAAQASKHAIANQNRLPFLDRYYNIAMHAYASRDFETASAAYNQILERFPDDVRSLNNLALIYRDRRQFPVAESLFARAIQMDSSIVPIYYGLHNTQVNLGKFDDARRTLDLIARRFPGDAVLGTVEVQDASARLDWDTAERLGEARIAEVKGDTLQLVDAYEALATIVMTRGRLAEAERYWRTQLALSAKTGSLGRHLFGAIRLAYLDLRYRRAPKRAIALVDSVLRRVPLDSVLPGDRPYDELARFYSAAGNLAVARQFAAAADENDRTLRRTQPAERTWTRGLIALNAGNSAQALPALQQAGDGTWCTMCALPDLARAYEASGKPQAAVAVYERYLTTPWLWRFEIDAFELGQAMNRLAELYDERGEAAKAAAMRVKLLQLWRRADPELAPELAAVRARLTG